MKYPNRIQAALLLDQRFEELDAITRDFARIIEMKSGATFNIPEHQPGAFARLFGGGAELMLTFEYVEGPPDETVLEGALASPVTAIRTPDMPDSLCAARSHILLEVSQGTLGGLELDPDTASLMQELGAVPVGATQADFTRRLETLSLMARVATDHIQPSVIHWTQSDQLFEPEAFEAALAEGFPGPLTLHPLLYSQGKADDAPGSIGLRTFGARHWLGRELHVPPSVLPWSAAFQTALGFCTAAAAPDAKVPADGDTYETPDGGEIWRVHHRDDASDPDALSPKSDTIPLYELVPLRHDAYQFLTDDYALQANVLCNRTPKPKSETAATAADQAETEAASSLAELEAALAEGRAEAAANPPEPLPATLNAGAPSQPGDATVSGRSLRARVFGARDALTEAPGDAYKDA